jgi:DNA-binding Lrp family transcriptional regulator
LQKQPKIDETAAKILHSLLKESRTTFNEIAKNCKITVNAVRSRFERLKRDGVITGDIMQINPQRLGYNFVADVGITTASENEKRVIESLKRKPYIIFGGPGFSWKYNISIFVAAPSVEKLAGIRDDLEANPLIKNVDAQIWVETINIDHPENLVLNSFKISQTPQAISKKPSEGSVLPAEINKIDKQIAKILSENA